MEGDTEKLRKYHGLAFVLLGGLVFLLLDFGKTNGMEKGGMKTMSSPGESRRLFPVPPGTDEGRIVFREEFLDTCYIWKRLERTAISRLVCPYLWSLNGRVFAFALQQVLRGMAGVKPEFARDVEKRLSFMVQQKGGKDWGKSIFSCRLFFARRIAGFLDGEFLGKLRASFGIQACPLGRENEVDRDVILMTKSKLSLSHEWMRHFDSCCTAKGRFLSFSPLSMRLTPRSVVYMGGLFTTPWFRDEGFTAVSLGLKGIEDLKFVVIMPKNPANPRKSFQGILRFEKFWGIVHRLQKRECSKPCFIRIPKIGIKRENSLYLGPWIGKMFKNTAIPKKNVLGKEFIQFAINEAGISLEVKTMMTCRGVFSGERIKFDRPFLFCLLDVKRKAILVLGEYLGPESGNK